MPRPRGGGGGVVHDLQFRARVIKFICFLRNIFVMWVGGLGRAEEPRLPSPPPPRRYLL